MADEKQYRTVFGIVQFDPREAKAAGKDVRNIVVRQTGFGPTAVRVSATLWPSFDHVKVEKGDIVILDGAYTRNETTGDDGEKRVFHNLSVNQIAVLGRVDFGERVSVENSGSGQMDDDEDLPF
jgi:hypothetical protein